MPATTDPHRLAHPPGRRTCFLDDENETPGDGGVWHVPRDKRTGGALWWAEDYGRTLARFEGQPKAMLVAELRSKLARGTRGELSYGHDPEHDVERIQHVDHVLEIRLGWQHGDTPLSRLHARVYFSEPSDEPGVLKLLTIDCKHDFPAGKDEQNAHATRAESRLDSCTFEPLSV